jgi:hypothetical protein
MMLTLMSTLCQTGGGDDQDFPCSYNGLLVYKFSFTCQNREEVVFLPGPVYYSLVGSVCPMSLHLSVEQITLVASY